MIITSAILRTFSVSRYAYHMIRLLIDLISLTKFPATRVATYTKMLTIPGYILVLDVIPVSSPHGINRSLHWMPIYDFFDNLSAPGNSAGSILIKQMNIHITFSCEDHVTDGSSSFRPLEKTPGPNWTEITCYGKAYGNLMDRSYMTTRECKVEVINHLKILVVEIMDTLRVSIMDMKGPEFRAEAMYTLLYESRNALLSKEFNL